MPFRGPLAALWAALLVASCAAPAPPAARYALVYGVSRYLNDASNRLNLSYCDDDARALADLLRADGYEVTERTDLGATRAALEADVAALAGSVGPRDLVLLYFSGHGGLLGDFGLDASAAPGYPPNSQWIFPYDAIDPAFSGQWLEPADLRLELAISDRDLAEILARVTCDRMIVVIDACNSGGFIGAGAAVDALPPDYDTRSVVDRGQVLADAVAAYLAYAPASDGSGVPPAAAVVLAAAGPGEPSYEYSVLGHGVFTYALLQAAVEGDANGDGLLTTLEAFAFATRWIQDYWNGPLGASSIQAQFLPRLSGGATDLVLLGSP